MSANPKLKEVYEVESKHGAFYTGGNIQWHGDFLYCQTENAVNILNIVDGTVTKQVGEVSGEDDSDPIQTFTSDGDRIVTAHKSGLLKLWNGNGELEKNWKCFHRGPVVSLELGHDRLISSGADGNVRVWDLRLHTCVLCLKECQGVVNVAKQRPNEEEILATGDDGKIYHWDLYQDADILRAKLKAVYHNHYSKVTSIVFSHTDQHFVSCGRDKVMILWAFFDNAPLKTIPFGESVECIVGLPTKFKLPGGFKSEEDEFYVASAGERGVVRVWDVRNVKEVYVQDDSLVTPAVDGAVAVTHLLCNEQTKTLAVISVEQNVILHHLKSFACLKQFVGFADEIQDVAYMGDEDENLVVATNSNDIKVYNDSTMSCEILKGHTDIVLSLAIAKRNPKLLLSSGKDNSIRLWLYTYKTQCIGVGKRHTEAVGSCCFSQTSTKWAVSVSRDSTLKKWDIPNRFDKAMISLVCTNTVVAHQKDINCVTVAPNDKLIATASQDKTVKLWDDNLELLGTLRGHKRGVWCARFSPTDQVVVTSSADSTLKLWNVNDLSCLKTFEGHESSVLRVGFLSGGTQIVSTGADGLLKIFNIKTSECQLTADEHSSRIWGLAISKDESKIVTGGSDSNLIKWKDVTEIKREEKAKELEERQLEEQKLSNYMHKGQLLKALKFALRLDKPFTVLNIVKDVIKSGETGLTDAITSLRDDQKDALMKCAVNWNTNSKNCQASQLVINILLNEIQVGEFKPSNFPSIIEGTLPYTERHFKRLTQLMQDLHFINYTMSCMKPNIKNKT